MHRHLLPIGVALVFLAASAALAWMAMPDGPLRYLVVLASAAAGYMALNVGANDVANNMGPAVGAKALTMVGALAIAAIFDAAGALLAGGAVVDTVANDLLTLEVGVSGTTLILVMIAGLLAGALWINASTFVGAPVSTTHALIGGVVGAAIAAAGVGAVVWPTITVIAVSWTLSPVLGGVLAATLHALIRRLITRQPDKIAAAKRWVPVLIAAMAGTFAIFLATTTPNSPFGGAGAPLFGSACAATAWLIASPWVHRRSKTLENRKKQVARLFRPPLIAAAALLSFAHGANDVANAIGPLVAILNALTALPAGSAAGVPHWGLVIGGVGIALGIGLFGSRVIHTVGEQITKLNEIRAFCVALASAATLLAASALGLPISSTHVAVGAVFGVGFLREYLAIRNMEGAAVPIETYALDANTLNATPEQAIARERRYERRYLVRRFKVVRIFAAWLVTLPASALMAAGTYWLLDLAIA